MEGRGSTGECEKEWECGRRMWKESVCVGGWGRGVWEESVGGEGVQDENVGGECGRGGNVKGKCVGGGGEYGRKMHKREGVYSVRGVRNGEGREDCVNGRYVGIGVCTVCTYSSSCMYQSTGGGSM